MKKRIAAMILVLAMVLALAACGSKQEPAQGSADAEPAAAGSSLAVCLASEPDTIDPALNSAVDGATLLAHLFSGLAKWSQDANGNLVIAPDAAEELVEGVENEDGTVTYTYTLRDGLVWSDGQPVTAGDFEFAWQRAASQELAADYGYMFEVVDGYDDVWADEPAEDAKLNVKAIDDKTLEITLEAPCAYFLEMCAFASLVPLRQDVVEGNDNWTDPANIVVNGPYKVVEWVHDSYLRMEPNEYYYDAANLGPDAIVWWLSDSETAILSAYQSGEYDFIESFPTDLIAELQASGDCFINPYVGTYYLYLNCSKITDWRVRAAMVLSVDRDNIVENVTQGGQVPATGFVASGILDSTGTDFAFGVSELGAIYNTLQTKYPDADLSTYAGKCELAKQLYDEAVAEGTWDPSTTVVYNFNTSETHKAIAEACGHDWQDVLGMNITLENQEWATYTNGLGEHNFGVARLGWIADYNDPVTYLELMVTGNSYNYGLYSDESFDADITQAKASLAGPERDALLYRAEETLFGEGGFPVCPIYYYTNMYCMTGLTNVGYTGMGYFFFWYAQQA